MRSTPQHLRMVTDLVWNRLIAILEDQAQTLIRTAFSTTTRESGDLSAGLFDRRGRMIAQAVTGTPGHVNSMALAVRHFLTEYPLETLAEGDVLGSNDPWICSGHLHDFTMVTPIIAGGIAIGAVANTIHVADIGGSGFGAGARDVHEEGLCIPVCKFVERGEINPLLTNIIRMNVRSADEVIGDLHSSIVSNAAAASRTVALVEEFGLADLEAVSDNIIERTRQTVAERISLLPDGRYTNQLTLDGDDGDEVLLKIAVVVEGDRMILDFDGSPPSRPRGLNVVLNYTSAYAAFGVNCLLNPDIPCNDGSLSPIEIKAPVGSILNAERPAAVSARHMIGQMLPDLVFGALEAIMAVPAEGAGLIWNPSIRGRTATGRPFSTVAFNAGGAGAQEDRDGWNATAFPSGVKAAPVEAIEASAPLLIRRKELRPDSGGAGKHRGGLGQIMEIEADGEFPVFVNAMFDRIDNVPQGRAGGLAAMGGKASLSSGRPFAAKGLQEMLPGEVLILELPGGAGWGSPTHRQADVIAEDVRQGYVSPAAAARDYGVIPDA